MSRASIIVGTAGHIDHGKTTLIHALTGVNTDRLQEEQQRGITIELGFAPLDIGDLHIGFVDVPGHEKFVKHMLAGAGGIDAMLLIVAADESIMPQTREHVEICRLLNIKSALVAITKTDLADEETVELVTLEVTDLIEANGYGDAEIIPVSATDGAGLDSLKEAFTRLAETVEQKRLNVIPRLPIDRVFTLKGFGTIVTGTLVSGALKVGDTVELLPSQTKSVVKNLQVHGENVSEAVAGHRVAVNVPGLGTADIERGEMITQYGVLQPSAILDLHCSVLASSPCDLEHNQRVRFHTGSAELIGRIALLDGRRIAINSTGFVRIRLERPTSALIGDRFVLRRYSPMMTIGGGVVLDNQPSSASVDKKTLLDNLSNRIASEEELWPLQLVKTHPGIISAAEITGRFGLLKNEAEQMMRQALENGDAVEIDPSPLQICNRNYFEYLENCLVEALQNQHETQSLMEGFALDSLKKYFPHDVSDQVYRAVVRILEQENKISISSGLISLSGFKVSLGDDEQSIYEAISDSFRKAGMSPPNPAEEIAKHSHKNAKSIFDLLIARGELKRIAKDFFLHRKALDDLVNSIKNRAGQDGFVVPDFKEWFGISRKYAIPLLEYLDSQSITYRDGDVRKLSKRIN